MIIILHGENTIKSRARLTQLVNDLKVKNQEIIRLEAKKLELAQLEETLLKNSLFGNQETLIIEELHSLPKSKKKDELISLLANSTQKDIILWEKRDLTATMLKKFPQGKAEQFKLTNALFSWLDLFHHQTPIKQNLQALQKAIKNNGDYMCFIMLARQISLLIYAKDGGQIKGAPFMISKLKKQAQAFSFEKLLGLHKQLFELDQQMKSSKNLLTLEQALDVLTISLYN
jgi:DNA polymerase III delta subunit